MSSLYCVIKGTRACSKSSNGVLHECSKNSAQYKYNVLYLYFLIIYVMNFKQFKNVFSGEMLTAIVFRTEYSGRSTIYVFVKKIIF